MSVVSKTTYESLADYIGLAYGAQRASIPYVESGLTVVVNLDDADQEYDNLYQWYNANENRDNLASTTNFTSLAGALNAHVETRSGKTIAQFLTDESITVSSDFAEVSKDAGYDIDDFIAP
jgi:hypothetical protein